MKSYRLHRATRLNNTGIIRHEVLLPGGIEGQFKYSSVRTALAWPQKDSPACFCVAGEEVWDDKLEPSASARGVIRIIQVEEIEDLSLDSLFDSITSAYSSFLADSLYCDFKSEDYKLQLFQYLDAKNLRNVSAMDVAYRDPVLRLGIVKKVNDEGNLIIEKGTPLYQDMQGLSRAHLTDDFEVKFSRLNALSYLISGFEKFPPRKPWKEPRNYRHAGGSGWMF